MSEADRSLAGPAAAGQAPSTARVYDALLGGSHNFAVDRQTAEAVRAALPGIEAAARANRAFLRRAVRHLLDLGVEQYLDLGSGLPTVGNVHEIVHRRDPAGRVVYVDIDPVAVAHSHAILREQPSVTAVQADLRDPPSILSRPDVRRLLHPDRPTGVLAVASLHFVPDSDDPGGIIAAYRDALPGGGYLVVSHVSEDRLLPEQSGRIAAARSVFAPTRSTAVLRTADEVAGLLGAWGEIAEPGVVPIQDWNPEPSTVDDPPEGPLPVTVLVGLARTAGTTAPTP